MRRICIRGLAGMLAIASVASAAAARNPLRFEELAKVARIRGFDVSPDGQWVVYALGTPVVAENRTASALWPATYLGGARPDPEALNAVSSVTK